MTIELELFKFFRDYSQQHPDKLILGDIKSGNYYQPKFITLWNYLLVQVSQHPNLQVQVSQRPQKLLDEEKGLAWYLAASILDEFWKTRGTDTEGVANLIVVPSFYTNSAFLESFNFTQTYLEDVPSGNTNNLLLTEVAAAIRDSNWNVTVVTQNFKALKLTFPVPRTVLWSEGHTILESILDKAKIPFRMVIN